VRWQHIDVFGSNVPGGVPLQHKKLASLHPVEIARITDAVSYHQGAEIIASLDDTLAADTLEEIVAERQTDIVDYIPEERAADILEEMAPDEATDLLAELPEEKAGALLKEMDQEEADEVRQLMRYPENSAGGTMTTDFVCVTPDMTVDQVIEENKPIFLSADLIYYMYVVDSEENDTLVGIITVRDLLVHQRDKPVGEFMLKDFLSARPAESRKEVARKMAEYNLLALPVVDRNNKLLGVVTVDDALDALLPEGWKKRLPRIFS
jgi:Mg/Co/Ni transporter MgtE